MTPLFDLVLILTIVCSYHFQTLVNTAALQHFVVICSLSSKRAGLHTDWQVAERSRQDQRSPEEKISAYSEQTIQSDPNFVKETEL